MDLWEKAAIIVNDIKQLYGNRDGTQPEIAKIINEKYATHLTTEDIAKVTRQLYYWHTIRRADITTAVVFLDETFRKHIE